VTLSVVGLQARGAHEKRYLRPVKRNEMDVDAVWWDETRGMIFLQATIGQKREVEGRRMREILEQLGEKNAELWFVVPEENMDSFVRPKVKDRNLHVWRRVAALPLEGRKRKAAD